MPKCENTEQYIAGCDEPIADLLKELRVFIHEQLPQATEGMQYGVPIFMNVQGVPVLYLFGSDDHVNFGFMRYDALTDPDGILKGSGKPSKHVEINPGEVIDTEMLGRFITQCAQVKS